MMTRVCPTFFLFIITILPFSRRIAAQQKVFTQDIDNFWQAFDSIKTTTDSARQIQFINTLYIDKGTPGLKAFMKVRNYSAPLYVSLIRKYPKFWNSIRPHTLIIQSKGREIEASIEKFKTLYPQLKDAKMYFTIGGLRSGGTTSGNMVLIGAEIGTGDSSTDVSEFPDKWLASVFREARPDDFVALNIHEYVHTQQRGDGSTLLAKSINEGSCDFIAGLVIGEFRATNYMKYGVAHEAELKEKFKEDMFGEEVSKWLYNGSNAATVSDLGYFIGFQICQSYYTNATDKKLAIKDIIELKYADTNAVESFLQQSKYFKEPINKEELLRVFRENHPTLVETIPIRNGDNQVDTSLKELTLVFSEPMAPGYSIDFGNGGKNSFPISGVVGLSEDKKRFTVKLGLQPDHEYEIKVSNRSFRSLKGYSLLKEYLIKFKTKQ